MVRALFKQSPLARWLANSGTCKGTENYIHKKETAQTTTRRSAAAKSCCPVFVAAALLKALSPPSRTPAPNCRWLLFGTPGANAPGRVAAERGCDKGLVTNSSPRHLTDRGRGIRGLGLFPKPRPPHARRGSSAWRT